MKYFVNIIIIIIIIYKTMTTMIVIKRQIYEIIIRNNCSINYKMVIYSCSIDGSN